MQTDTAPSVLIDAAELARMLSVSKPTIWRMRDDAKLPPSIALTSQCIRWQRDLVLSWIDAGCPAQQQRPAGTNGEASAIRPSLAGEVAR